MQRRLRFAISHLVLSAIVISLFAALVLFVWYPAPLARIQGVYKMLQLIILVDVCLGPFLTLTIASPKKNRSQLFRELAVIALVQVAALGYGAYATFVARPAFIVFNANRFDVVPATELVWRPERLTQNHKFRSAPLFGPIWVHARPPSSNADREEIFLSAVEGGIDLKNLPDLFEKWPGNEAAVRPRLLSISDVSSMSKHHQAVLDQELNRLMLSAEELAYVPLVGREGVGIALLRRSDLKIKAALDLTLVY